MEERSNLEPVLSGKRSWHVHSEGGEGASQAKVQFLGTQVCAVTCTGRFMSREWQTKEGGLFHDGHKNNREESRRCS